MTGKDLPEPALTFTIPSINDGTVLDCRIYHPASLLASPNSPPWTKHGVILAHPYAPLGGCFDDPILEVLAAALLREGYLVMTFNFRGAGNSVGRTSWSAKPERDDYMSTIGFLSYYLNVLDPFHLPRRLDDEPSQAPTLIMAGYSYGAMVTATIPPLPDIIEKFTNPESHSHAAQIRLRAESLAQQQNIALGDTRAAMLAHRVPSSPSRRAIRVGGSEGSESPKRQSGEFKHGVHELGKALRTSMHVHKRRSGDKNTLGKPHTGDADEHEKEKNEGKLPPLKGFKAPRAAYLLISPLQGIVTHVITMPAIPTQASRSSSQAAENKLAENPTLAVYGDNDVFVGVGKLRAWKERLTSKESSQFDGEEIALAGHFWIEEGVIGQLVEMVRMFARKVWE